MPGDGSPITGGGTPIVTGGDTTHSGAPGTGSPGNGTGSGTTGSTPTTVPATTTGLPPIDPPLRVLSPLPFGQLSDTVITGVYGRFGVKEAWTLINPATVARTWSGKAILNGSSYKKKHKITWTASGKGILEQPAFTNLQPGDPANIWALTPHTAYIDVGQTSVDLEWDPVPPAFGGRILATLASTGQVIPVGRQSGSRTVNLLRDPGGDIVMVRYRPFVPVFVLKWGASIDHLDGSVQWSVEMEEQ